MRKYTYPGYIAPTDPIPGFLLSSLTFCYKIFLWFSKISLALAPHNWQFPDQSSITLVFCYWLSIDSHCWTQIARSHRPDPWYFSVVTGLLLSNLHLILEKIPCTCTPQFIDSWSIINYPGLLLFIVNWFTLLTPDCLLLMTWSLVFCCCHWYSAIKYSSEFRKISLHLHSTIDRPLINTSTMDRPPINPW